MKSVFLERPIRSFAIERCVKALEDYCPPYMQIATQPEYANVVVLQVNGRVEHLKKKIASYNKPYVLVQHVFKSSMNPDEQDWREVWDNAALVWSHYDLPIKDYYRSPLGVSSVFEKKPQERKYLIMTSGQGYLQEGVRECIKAAEGIGRVLQVGPDCSRGHDHVDVVSGVTDAELADLYSQCRFTCGLRRIEGFELPCAEGLFSGARPVLFDQPHYRHWFGEFGEFIPENSRPDVEASLRALFLSPEKPVLAEEWALARSRFNWETIILGFYEHLKLFI